MHIQKMTLPAILQHCNETYGMPETLAHIETMDGTEDYGYTQELRDEIASLRAELFTLRAVLPETFLARLETLSLADLLAIEQRLA